MADGRYSGRANHLLTTFAIPLLSFVSLSLSPAAYAQVAVSTCGTSYQGNGYLATDLFCSGPAVTIQGYGELDLRGHTITTDEVGVLFDAEKGLTCRVVSSEGMGYIAGPGPPGAPLVSSHGIRVIGDGSVRIDNVTISNFQNGIHLSGLDNATLTSAVIERSFVREGVSSSGTGVRGAFHVLLDGSSIRDNESTGVDASSVRATDSEVVRNGAVGISVSALAKLIRTTVADNGSTGVSHGQYRPLKAVDCVFSGNGASGVTSTSRRMTLLRCEVSGNGDRGVSHSSGTTKIKDSGITGNAGAGVYSNSPTSSRGCKMVVARSTVTGNAGHGLVCGSVDRTRLSIRKSGVTANGGVAECGTTIACADLASDELPRIKKGATCDTSYVLDSGIPGSSWSVCALD
jgi:hypothetical protein